MRSRRFALPAFTALTVALSTVAVSTAPAATAVDEFTCKSSAPIFDVRQNGQLHVHHHEEPETGANSWGAARHIGNGWPASTYAGPSGKMYHINAGGELHLQTYLGGGSWADNGVSKLIRTLDSLKIYNTDPAYHKRFTVDSRGDFYLVDRAGTLRRWRYNETTGSWLEWILDAGWNQYDAIVAAGNGVIYARTPAGNLYRHRYDAVSQRWVSRSGVLGGGWNVHSLSFSPGADIVYGVHGQYKSVWWYRYIESENRWAQGSGVHPAGSGWAADGVAGIASNDTCKSTSETNPATPAVDDDLAGRAALVRTSNGYLQYAYVSADRGLVHAEVRDLYNLEPSGFRAFPGFTGYTGTPTMSENDNGMLRVYGHGTDAGAHGFAQLTTGGWSGHNDLAGRVLSAPQLVRTANKLQTMVAFDATGAIWMRPQMVINGGLHAWRRPAGGFPMSPGTKAFTALTAGDSIVLIALNAGDGRQCRTTITAAAQAEWQCSATNGFTGAAAVVTLPDNTLQLYSRKANGTVHTVRTAANGTIPDTWTQLPGTLPSGVSAVGAPAALRAPNGTLQVAVRGSDGYTYRTGQVAPGSTAWHPWTEIYEYGIENAVDPTMSLAGDTWVVAFRTPAGEPKLLRWRPDPSLAAAKTSNGTGGFVEVPLQG